MEQSEPAKARLLIVDDDPDIRLLVNMGLRIQGYDVETAETGQAAIDLLANESFDLIILDILMPVMDGIRFLHWLRDEQSDQTPVLVHSAVVSRDIEQEALAAGATQVLPKPKQLPELLKAIQKTLGG